MTDWATLSDACGSAEHVPALLDRFEADPSGVWSELMDHLCPQLDTAFPAAFAALPRLARIATACGPESLADVLLAAGAIVACVPGPTGPLSPCRAPLATLHRLTDQHLSRTTAADEYVCLLQALLAFEGIGVWARCLEGLHTGEYEVDCPHCGVDVFVVIGEDETFCSTDDYALKAAAKSPLRPLPPNELEPLAKRLHDRALADSQDSVARAVPYLFGRAACPDCGAEYLVADRVVARWGGTGRSWSP
ncbi:hypothetical protein [Streptomyces sp. 3N207]|uniref:hypothetical protein n=1 Tax=Streptomyces sp. 3N207 TaxID=3457417 RepID=UPI003FD1E43F